MTKVRLLDDELINKIAAGEVVERPASVVKELVENAIDAGATHIRVLLKDGGRQLIQVEDDGSGMEAEDAVLAVKRHTTSKLQHADELFQVQTMGFRGEALASISAVSRFTLQTQARGAEQGARIVMNGSDLKVLPWQGPYGTSLTVADLFFNVPVRKTFMKTAAAEFAACHEYMQALALSLPQVGFTLVHNDREIFSVSPLPVAEGWPRGMQAIRQRAEALFGKDTVEGLIYVHKQDRYTRIEGLISAPGQDKGSAKHIFTFVNQRWVRDKLLRYGIMRGYHSHLLKGKFPLAFLHIDMETSLVDVNVHPAKAELRFQYGTEVQNAIALALREGLRASQWAEAPDSRSPTVDGKKSATGGIAPGAVLPDDFDLMLGAGANETLARDAVQARSGASSGQVAARAFDKASDEAGKSGIKRTTMSFDRVPPERSDALRATPPAEAARGEVSPSGYDAARPPAFDGEGRSTLRGDAARSGAGLGSDASGSHSPLGSDATRSTQGGYSRSPLGSDALRSHALQGSDSRSLSEESATPDGAASARVNAPNVGSNAGTSELSSLALKAQRKADEFNRARELERTINAPAKVNEARGLSFDPTAPTASRENETIPWEELRYIGAFSRCYLMFEYREQLLAVDQHAFHERVLYERLSRNPELLERSQPLLMPEAIAFSPSEIAELREQTSKFAQWGLRYDVINDEEIEVKAVPSLLTNKDISGLVHALLAGARGRQELAHDVLATLACHAAVRAGEDLPEAELKILLREAQTVDFYHNCPHGRRVFRWWKQSQVAAWFDRLS